MNKTGFVSGIAALVIAADQATKWYIRQHMGVYESIPVIDSIFHITYARNTGAAFSMLADAPAALRVPFFMVMTVVALAALVYFLRQVQEDQRVLQFALAGILGGAVGNFIDRILIGSVTDFLDVHWHEWTFPTFNVADSFITIGMAVLLLHSLLESTPDESKQPRSA